MSHAMKRSAAERREEAEERQAERNTRSPEVQLSRLERQGHGHCKEADKLREQISATLEKDRQRAKGDSK